MKGFHTVMRHQCWAFGGRFSQIGDHGHRGVVSAPVRLDVSRDQTPNGGVRVLRSCVKMRSKWWDRIWPRFVLTPWEQIEVTISKEVIWGLGVLLPDGILLNVYGASSVFLTVNADG